MLDIENLQIKFPTIRPKTMYSYQVDKCQHGKECIFLFSMFTGQLMQISCNWCAEECGYNNPTTIHSNLCQDYNCMCDLEFNNVLTFLTSCFHDILPYDMIEYLVPFYQKLYICKVCEHSRMNLKECVHCHSNVCRGCTIDSCDTCHEALLCRQCLQHGHNYFTTLLHGIECHNCLYYKMCKMCCDKSLKKCGWCFQYMCPSIQKHTCQYKYDIINKRDYYWLQRYTNFDNLFQETADWYHSQNKHYEAHILYDYIEREAVEEYIEQGGDVCDVPTNIRHIVL